MSSPEKDLMFQLGLIGGSCTAFLIIAVCFSIESDNQPDALIELIKEWQTLIAGALALIGAYITVSAVRTQIALQREQEVDRISRKHSASRAALPLALVEFGQYAKDSYVALKAIAASKNQSLERIFKEDGWVAPRLPRIPSTALAVLRDCIESAEPDTANGLASLIEEFQILHSRLGSLIEDVGPCSTAIILQHNVNEQILKTIEFDIRCGNLFDYARRKSNLTNIPIQLGDISTRIVFEKFETIDGLTELAARRYEAGNFVDVRA